MREFSWRLASIDDEPDPSSRGQWAKSESVFVTANPGEKRLWTFMRTFGVVVSVYTAGEIHCPAALVISKEPKVNSGSDVGSVATTPKVR